MMQNNETKCDKNENYYKIALAAVHAEKGRNTNECQDDCRHTNNQKTNRRKNSEEHSRNSFQICGLVVWPPSVSILYHSLVSLSIVRAHKHLVISGFYFGNLTIDFHFKMWYNGLGCA